MEILIEAVLESNNKDIKIELTLGMDGSYDSNENFKYLLQNKWIRSAIKVRKKSIISCKQPYDQQISINRFSLCFHMGGYPKNPYFLNHLPALQSMNLTASTIKRYKKICHMRYNAYLKEETDIFKKMWIRLLEEYDHKKGIKWTLQSILDSISIKSPLW
jgi:hypothetical protein